MGIKLSWSFTGNFLMIPLFFLVHVLALCVAHGDQISVALVPQISFEYDQRGACNVSIGECNDEEEEMMMESEISRRFMAEQNKYISPGALKKDEPVCDGGGRGRSYTNSGSCLGRPANPASRPCYKIYRCRNNS